MRTKSGTFQRPIQRVYPLELSYSSENEAKDMRAKLSDKVVSEPVVSSEGCQVERSKEKEYKTHFGRIVRKPRSFLNCE